MPQKDLFMYGRMASWWPLLSAPADYAEEADFYRRILELFLGRAPRK